MKKIIKPIVFLAVIFITAFAVWLSPVLFKGFIPQDLGSPSIILGKNIAQTGVYGSENDLNIVLSSSLVKDQAHLSSQGNKLTAVIYGEIFKITGLLSEKELLLLSVILQALALVIFALTVLYLFGYKIASLFSLIYILLPFSWQLPYSLGPYGFCLLFFSLFLLCYFFGISRQRQYLYLIPAGIFLALACLTKETIFFFLPFFFAYLWFKSSKRNLLYILVPLLILLGCLWVPDVLKANNAYLLHFNNNASEELKSADFARFTHLFPDPYTYHFDKEEFLGNIQNQLENDKTSFWSKADLIKTMSNTGYLTPSLWERMAIGSVLAFDHFSRFFSLEEIGGPLIFLLMILGVYSLKQKNKQLYSLSLGWIISIIFLLSFVALAGRSHLMDFGWIIALLVSLGLALLIEILNKHFNFTQKKSAVLFLILTFIFLYSLILTNHVVWNQAFESTQTNLLIEAYSQKIKALNIADQDVIAVPIDAYLYRINYLNDKSLVLFRTKTIEGLLDKNELASAFEKFNVKYILGYSPELSQKIEDQTAAVNIATDSLKVPEIKTSAFKMWLMNFVR
jgi:hypothetical protein